jgi:hypothetical protein
MGKYGIYDDTNLIKYGETIQLHFNSTGEKAWLTLKNYGLVFHEWPWAPEQHWSSVFEVTMGSADDELTGEFESEPELCRPIDIGAMLDVFEVIEFQVAILKAYKAPMFVPRDKTNLRLRIADKFETPHLVERIDQVLLGMGAQQTAQFKQEKYVVGSQVAAAVYKRLILMLRPRPSAPPPPPQLPPRGTRGPIAPVAPVAANPRPPVVNRPGALWIQKLIEENSKLHSPQKRVGFTAYFPDPNLILEEQKTKLDIAKPLGVTQNEDMRPIKPIPFGCFDNVVNGATPHFQFEEVFEKLDQLREKDEEEFLRDTPLTQERQDELRRENFKEMKNLLHKHVPRISCYGFRGDDRDLAAIKAATGFLPGVTRGSKDRGLKPELKIRGNEIDEMLIAGMHATVEKIQAGQEIKDDEPLDYWKKIKSLGVLTLTVYTLDQTFKGFISTTTSTAIAKCFANYWAPPDDPFRPTYCYALRCKGGFHLPTEASGAYWDKKKYANNVFTHNAEQEVAVPGSIWWDDVVGMRKIRVDEKGQYFCGPVFLNDLIRQEEIDKIYAAEQLLPKIPTVPSTDPDIITLPPPTRKLSYLYPDNHAFDELFELFSGRSQGMHHGIRWSYDIAPFGCPSELMEHRKKVTRARTS